MSGNVLSAGILRPSIPDCETLGAPGFFGVEFFFQPENGQFYEKLCPAPVTPKYLIKEFGTDSRRKKELLYSTGSTYASKRGGTLYPDAGFSGRIPYISTPVPS
jgi:hypothetical protein